MELSDFQCWLSLLFQLPQHPRQRLSCSAHRAALMTKTVFILPAFSTRFVDFAVQFCFRCKFSFHGERRASQVWQWRDFLEPIKVLLLRVATKWDCFICMDNRLSQMDFFVFVKVDTVGYPLVCHFFVLTAFWRHLWSIAEQTLTRQHRIYLLNINSMLRKSTPHTVNIASSIRQA